MRVILDECLPRRLGSDLAGHLVTTVPQAGWAGVSNGKLLALIAGTYDAFIRSIRIFRLSKRLRRYRSESWSCALRATGWKT